jgi:hypothetical protein
MPLRIAMVLLLSVAMTPDASLAQIRASERGSVSQTIDGTVITVDYARPQIRGRDSVFGRVVRKGETWTPGANWATTLEASRPIRLNGLEVPAGKYSVWFVTGDGEWKVHLHRTPRLFHTQHPKLDQMFLSVAAAPATAEPPLEVLTFDFPRVGRDGATLRFRWGQVSLPLEIAVQSSRAAIAASEDAFAPYLGSYEMTMEGEDGKTVVMKAELINANGSLRAVIDGAWGPMTMEFVPTDQPHQFRPAFVDKGQIVDVEEVPVIFEMEGGRAVGFKIMGIGDDVWMRGKRKS